MGVFFAFLTDCVLILYNNTKEASHLFQKGVPMRRILSVLLIMVFLLCGCGTEKADPVYTSRGYTVDTEAQTMTKDGNVFHYKPNGNGYIFTYPDGSFCSYQIHNNDFTSFTTESGSLDFDPSRWPSASELGKALHQETKSDRRTGNPLGLLLILLGALNAAFPHASWYLEIGWRFKDAEPSDLALGMERAGGVVIALVGFFMLF